MKVPEVITKDYLNKLDNGTFKDKDNNVIKMPDLTYDKNFKIFIKSNEKMLKKMINSVLHLNLNDIKIIYIDKEVYENNIDSHGSIYDYYLQINDNIYVDLEMYRNGYEINENKSYFYQVKQISTSLNSGEEYQSFNEKKFIQLNIVANEKSEIGEDIICNYSIIKKKIHIKNVITYVRYLDYYKNIYYNKFSNKKELEYWLMILNAKSFNELYEILKSFLDNELSNEIMKGVIVLSTKRLFTKQELININKQVEMDRERIFTKRGIEQGISQGIEKGAKEEKCSIAKKLMQMGMNVKDIIKVTNLTKEELKMIK